MRFRIKSKGLKYSFIKLCIAQGEPFFAYPPKHFRRRWKESVMCEIYRRATPGRYKGKALFGRALKYCGYERL